MCRARSATSPSRSASSASSASPQERYRFLVENSPDVVFSTDAEGRFTFMSESMERLTGWRPEEVVGEHFSKTVQDASHAEAIDSLGRR